MALKLNQINNFSGRKGPLLLIIMDGVGIGKHDDSDAVYLANTPNLDRLSKESLYTELQAHGTVVGLPSDKDMGNSEVGHNTMGAGRSYDQGAKRVNQSIESGEMFKTDTWETIIKRGKEGRTVHFIGLLSDGNVHSHIKHLYKFLRTCRDSGVKRVRLHPLLDGRDVHERSALQYIDMTLDVLNEINESGDFDYRFASGGGRMNVTMDRYEADWDIVKKGWDAHVLGKARKFKSAKEAVQTYYDEDPNITDQYLDSFVVVDEEAKPVGTIQDGDAVIFFNFRGDRAVELSKAFDEDGFDKFDRERVPDVFFAGMTLYDEDIGIPKHFLLPRAEIEDTISEFLCAEGVTMFALSETQKFGHVTYFWNGNKSGYICEELETYVEIPSDKIEFDKKPEMKAREIADKTIELMRTGKYRFGRLNFANGDMVGHTGKVDAAIKAVETVDECVGKLVEVVKELEGIALITADHGNSDEMFKIKDGKKQVVTSHSLNPVPFIIYDPNYNEEYELAPLDKPGIHNIASTIINLLGYDKPGKFAPSLVRFK
jgi:2,3-bisphosphoglycerate-independent phosphoglycerate mutase